MLGIARGKDGIRGAQIGAWMCVVLALIAGGNACSAGNSSEGVPQTDVGVPDRPSNGRIAVDEAGIVGTVVGDELHVEIPLSATASTAGELNVSTNAVDGSERIETVSVHYNLAEGAETMLLATLKVPEGVHVQADWVQWNLRVDDGTEDGLRTTTSLFRIVKPYEVRLEGPANVSKDKTVSYRVRAQQPVTQQPISGLEVQLETTANGTEPRVLKAVTNETGDAIFEITAAETGTLALKASTSADGTTATVQKDVPVTAPGRKVLVTTDKPIYQPGQKIHLRAVALTPPSNVPVAGAAVLFEIEDGKGNKIFKKETTSDDYGIAHSEFTIGSIVNEGTFKVRVTIDGVATEKTVSVSRYALPKFGVDVDIARPWYKPAENVTGTIDAAYFFGKTVAGADVVIEGYTVDVGETVFGRVMGKTDENGRMSFSMALPGSLVGLPLEQGNALASLRVTVTDTAGQVVTKEAAVTVAQDGVRISAVPESTVLVPGVENRLQIFASDPLGEPLPQAAVRVTVGSDILDATTNAFGYAELRFTPATGSDTFAVTVTVTPSAGDAVTQLFTFGAQAGAEHVLVRTDKSVYNLGDTVTVEIVASEGSARAYVDWLNEGQAVDMRTLDLQSGSGTFTMPLDTSLIGSNRVEAYIVDDDGNFVRAGRTIFARSDAALDVSMSADKSTYAPGEPAKLTFTVRNAQGNPTVAALGVQIVDEAVFSLVESRPGLLQTYFQLEDEYATPQYQLEAPIASFQDLLFDATRSKDLEAAQTAQAKTEASLAALGATSFTGIQEGSWTKVVTAARDLLAPYYDAAKTNLIAAVSPVVRTAVQDLENAGCEPSQYYCQSLNLDYATALNQRVRGAFSATDFWGNAYRAVENTGYGTLLSLATNGPDETSGTADDGSITILYADLDLEQIFQGAADAGAVQGPILVPGAVAFGGAGGAASGLTTGTGGTSASPNNSGSEGPRVRRDFPETLYVNPAIITDPDGTASIEVGLADSITQWRVSTLAHSKAGELGGGTAGITVFQDFFVDVDFPATLTRGDEIEFPIAVYNYLDVPQTVQVALDAGAWYTPLGATTLDVALEPGEVKGVRFPVRVEQVGAQTLTVRGLGTTLSDAVARSVQVVPDGKAFPDTSSGSLAPGSISHTVSFPANAVPGSEQLYVNVYPAFLSQVVEGMDAMLQVPNGCFEQTTSTAWPNVLVTNYMEATGQITPEIQAKAESLMSAGYQRLLTFEHPGGGFSWFGTQDPAPYLSVTAFGLMEFADMAKVHPVDEAMVDRTRTWLVSQQQADGSWLGDQSEFFSFQTSTVRNTAFVAWALASSGFTGDAIDRGLDYVSQNLASEGNDAYTLGVVANAFVLARPNDARTSEILAELDSMKQADGDKFLWDTNGTQTNFYGGGEDGAVATTALVAHALLLAGGYAGTVQGALQYLTGSKDALGNFGSTQATIWTLRTLVLAASKGTEGAVGTLTVSVDGTPFTTVDLVESQSDVMTTVDLSTVATTGDHDVALAFAGTGKVSYNLVSTHHLPWALVPIEPAGPLSLSVAYDKTALRLNETVTASVTVTNNTAAMQNMVLLTLGIPPGFSVLTEDLDQYKTTGVLSHYEVTGKQLILYLTTLAAGTPQTFSYRLAATMPVVAEDGGATASLYYEPDTKVTATAQQITVTEN